MKQLDLFDQSAALEDIMAQASVGAPTGGAAIIAFPQSRNVGRARRVAEKLEARQGKAKDSYWRRVCNDLASMLYRAGIDDRQVEAQIQAFHDAVSLELYRLHNSRAGGAA